MAKYCEPVVEVVVPRVRRDSDCDPASFDVHVHLMEQCLAGMVSHFFPRDPVKINVIFSYKESEDEK